MTKEQFTAELNKWMRRFQLTAAAAARILGVKARTLEGWRSGRWKPSMPALLCKEMRPPKKMK